MYTYPNSDLHILSGCPLEPSYVSTIYFDSQTNQAEYFSTLTKYSFEKYTFLRDRRVIKVERSVGDLYDCNYIMFRNTSYSSRWFYAFITNVEYVNDRTSYISFEIDVMQTWFFDYELQNVFVDREHSETDEFFEHTIDEGIGYGQLICQETRQETQSRFDCNGIILSASEPPEGSSVQEQGGTFYGMYTPLYTVVTSSLEEGMGIPGLALKQFIQTGKEDAVVQSQYIPNFMKTELLAGTPPEEPAVFTFNVDKNTSQLNGYVPRNKKLFNYPYNRLWLTNQNGSLIEYRYEDFDRENPLTPGVCPFKAYGVAIPSVEVVIVPCNYKGKPEYMDESLTITGYPLVPFVGDVYAAYMAQNSNRLAFAQSAPVQQAKFNAGWDANQVVLSTYMGALGSLVQPFSSSDGIYNTAATAQNVAGSLYGTISNTVQGGFNIARNLETANFQSQLIAREQLNQQMDLQNTPSTVHNLTSVSSTAFAIDKLRPVFMFMCVKPEYAAIIDDYFDRYGYKCNQMKIPNRNVRPHWTYTKTVGCTITARCPADAENAICKIYDSGITFWRYGDEVGNYSLDNTV